MKHLCSLRMHPKGHLWTHILMLWSLHLLCIVIAQTDNSTSGSPTCMDWMGSSGDLGSAQLILVGFAHMLCCLLSGHLRAPLWMVTFALCVSQMPLPGWPGLILTTAIGTKRWKWKISSSFQVSACVGYCLTNQCRSLGKVQRQCGYLPTMQLIFLPLTCLVKQWEGPGHHRTAVV